MKNGWELRKIWLFTIFFLCNLYQNDFDYNSLIFWSFCFILFLDMGILGRGIGQPPSQALLRGWYLCIGWGKVDSQIGNDYMILIWHFTNKSYFLQPLNRAWQKTFVNKPSCSAKDQWTLKIIETLHLLKTLNATFDFDQLLGIYHYGLVL